MHVAKGEVSNKCDAVGVSVVAEEEEISEGLGRDGGINLASDYFKAGSERNCEPY